MRRANPEVSFQPPTERLYLDEAVARDCRRFHGSHYWHFGPARQRLDLHQVPLALLEHHERALPSVRLSTDAEPQRLPRELPAPSALARDRSAQRFAVKGVELPTLAALLHHTTGNDEQGRRPHASAGALYPVELVVCANATADGRLPSGVYHYLPATGALECIRQHPAPVELVVEPEQVPIIGTPAVALLFVMNLARATFKYRRRGYRHALFEAGLMAQQADLVGKSLGLRSRLWSGFDDHKALRDARLNPVTFLPCMAQLFGYAAQSGEGGAR